LIRKDYVQWLLVGTDGAVETVKKEIKQKAGESTSRSVACRDRKRERDESEGADISPS
jgi:hypothetical protein